VPAICLLLTCVAQTNAQEVAAVTHPPQVILSTTAAKVGVSASDSNTNSTNLDTRPVGTHVFQTIAEVENAASLKPGATVDVSLATLGEEGLLSHRILRRVSVYSIKEVKANLARNGNSLTEVVDDSAADEQGESEIFPLKVIGLLVNRNQIETLRVADAQGVLRIKESAEAVTGGAFQQVWHNFTSNLFQPLLLFFFMGFAVPILKVPFEFPKPLYQSLTLYLLVAIGWHGGELMAQQSSSELAIAGGLAIVGFFVNGIIGLLATKLLKWFTPMREVDAVTVGAYYGSDSAGTFVTCLGILATLGILHDSYMPVLLAVMEIPGCLVGLFLVSRLRERGMDARGNMPGEPDYIENDSVSGTADKYSGKSELSSATEKVPAHQSLSVAVNPHVQKSGSSLLNAKLAHEVFLNPGLFLLFGGILIGFISGIQAIEDPHVVEGPDHLFIFLFKGALCLFLLEMGMTACRRLKDLRSAGPGFIVFGLLAPNLFATIGIIALHAYSLALGHHFYLGTYALFAVLCGAASYIAVPAVQRLAIPEASPTLPLAASLGLTFTWNVTIGIPIYIEIAKFVTNAMPV